MHARVVYIYLGWENVLCREVSLYRDSNLTHNKCQPFVMLS